MEYQVQIERQRTAEVSATAVDVISQIASNLQRQQALTTGCEAHGVAFAAFLLVPEVGRLDAENLHDTFTAAYCVKGESRNEATEQLLEHLGLERALRRLNDELDLDGFLRWDEQALREVLDEGYAFVQTFEGCYVFDLSKVYAALDD